MRKAEIHELARRLEGSADSIYQLDFLVRLLAFLAEPETERQSAKDWKYRLELTPESLRTASNALAEIADAVDQGATADSDDVTETMDTLESLRGALASMVTRAVGRA